MRPPPPKTPSYGYGQYTISFRNFVAAMNKGIRPLTRVRQDPPRDIVTMTLRECEHWPQRNSKLLEWTKAAHRLTAEGLEVVFVRDSRHWNWGDLVCFDTAPLASRDLAERATLYRSARCNMFISNGPAWFCLAADAPTIMLRPTMEHIGRMYSLEHAKAMGVDRMALPAHQRIVWEDDTADNIVAACLSFIR